MKRFQKLDDTGKAAWVLVTWMLTFDAALLCQSVVWWIIFIAVSIIHSMYLIYDTKMEHLQKELDRKREASRAIFKERMQFVEEYDGKERKE